MKVAVKIMIWTAAAVIRPSRRVVWKAFLNLGQFIEQLSGELRTYSFLVISATHFDSSGDIRATGAFRSERKIQFSRMQPMTGLVAPRVIYK